MNEPIRCLKMMKITIGLQKKNFIFLDAKASLELGYESKRVSEFRLLVKVL